MVFRHSLAHGLRAILDGLVLSELKIREAHDRWAATMDGGHLPPMAAIVVCSFLCKLQREIVFSGLYCFIFRRQGEREH
jgi:hypothetical protein